jgi:hypothetical protein
VGFAGLLLQGFARFCDEPRVLQRDHRLVGKGAHYEQFHPLPPETDRAENHPLAQQRHSQAGTYSRRGSLRHREVRVGGEVLDMKGF